MAINLKDFTIISKADLNALIESSNDNAVSHNVNQIEAVVLADYAYEAGKLDAELSLSFDNPKSRFLNSEVTIK